MSRLHYTGFALMVAVLGYSALWFTTAFALDEEIEAYANTLRAEGHRVQIGDIDVGGFPYRITASLKRVRLGAAGGGARITSDRVTAISHLWTPGHWVLSLEGSDLEIGDTHLTVSGDTAQASIRQSDQTGTSVAIDFDGSEGVGLSVNDRAAKVAFVSVRFGGETPVEQSLYAAPLFDFYGRFLVGQTGYEARGTVSGESFGPLDARGLAEWRDGGGLMTVHQARISQSGATLDLDGSLSLDERLRPLGSFSGLVSDTSEMPEFLRALGLSRRDVTLGEGGTVSLTVQNGRVLIDGISVGTVSPLP